MVRGGEVSGGGGLGVLFWAVEYEGMHAMHVNFHPSKTASGGI